MGDDLGWIQGKTNEDWDLVDNDNLQFINELTKELNENHLLYNRVEKAIMRRYYQDDVLYLLKDGKFAIVHLTYSNNNLPGWPRYKEFTTFEEVKNYIEKLREEE